MTTTFDTSGTVLVPHPTPEDAAGTWASDLVQWSDLSPFTQGYIEALFASIVSGDTPLHDVPLHVDNSTGWVFSDLAPETLARIIADCAAWTANRKAVVEYPGEGAALWVVRQHGGLPGFPPLTVQLGDDGKVRFAKATGEGA